MTPNRLKDSEAFMARLAKELVDEFAGDGSVELCHDFAALLTLLS